MIKISIIKNAQVTNQASFPTMEEAQAWLDKHEGMGTFGQKAQTIMQQVEIFPAVVDESGKEISPAQFETQSFDIPGYVVEITDISAQLSQEAINKEALEYLANTDWMVTRSMETGVEVPAEIKAERAAARARIIR
jgi:hypothetical protein